MAGEEMFGCCDRIEARCVESEMSTVVQQQVRAPSPAAVANDSLLEVCEDGVGADGIPVVTGDIPHHRREIQLARDAQDRRAARAEWWAEEADGVSREVFEEPIAVGKFLANAGRALECKLRMRHCVVRDEMARGGDVAHELRLLADKVADEEECGANVVLCKELEELRCAGWVRAVVVGEGEFVRVRAAEDGAAEELRGWPEGRIRKAANGESGGGSYCGSGSYCLVRHRYLPACDCSRPRTSSA